MKEPEEKTEMKTLVESLNGYAQKGFTEDFKVTVKGLKALKTDKIYQPEEVTVIDFYRFEGTSDPGDEAILWAIETYDGSKGTLVDAYGPDSDTRVMAFMETVEIASKKKYGKLNDV